MAWMTLVSGHYVDDSQVNSHKQQNKHMSTGKGIQNDPNIVIVGDYSVFVSKLSIRRIDETNVAAFKTIHS